jgi:hypothetical protein
VVIEFRNPPTDQNIKDLLSILDGESSYPVLVHCELGKERTGVAISIYRMERMGWTSGQALIEMLEVGQSDKLGYFKIHDHARFVAGYRPKFPPQRPGPLTQSVTK